MAQLFFVIMNLLAGYVAVTAAGLVMKSAEPWRRALVSLAGFPVVVLITVFILGNLGQLAVLPVIRYVCTFES